jgi:L-fuconolactonase
MIIDAHQHVWDLTRAPYPWLGPHVPHWNRNFGFEELLPHLARNAVNATVMVQSDDHDGDTDLMFEVADAHPTVVAIVAYLPLDRPEDAAARLADLRRDDRVVGIRNLVHHKADPDWIVSADVDEGLAVLEDGDVAFDFVSNLPRHLAHVPTLSERHPGLRIVIDHLAKPPIGERDVEPWWSLIAAAAQNPLVTAKISGLYPESGNWTVDGIRPFIDRALEVFGPERLMFGGDWPISVAGGGYDRVFAGLKSALSGLDAEDARHIWSETARRTYRIAPARLEAARSASLASSPHDPSPDIRG